MEMGTIGISALRILAANGDYVGVNYIDTVRSLVERAGDSEDGWRWEEMSGNGWRWEEMDGDGWTWVEMSEDRRRRVGMGGYGWRWEVDEWT